MWLTYVDFVILGWQHWFKKQGQQKLLGTENPHIKSFANEHWDKLTERYMHMYTYEEDVDGSINVAYDFTRLFRQRGSDGCVFERKWVLITNEKKSNEKYRELWERYVSVCRSMKKDSCKNGKHKFLADSV